MKKILRYREKLKLNRIAGVSFVPLSLLSSNGGFCKTFVCFYYLSRLCMIAAGFCMRVLVICECKVNLFSSNNTKARSYIQAKTCSRKNFLRRQNKDKRY
jgi:hypothetical protein